MGNIFLRTRYLKIVSDRPKSWKFDDLCPGISKQFVSLSAICRCQSPVSVQLQLLCLTAPVCPSVSAWPSVCLCLLTVSVCLYQDEYEPVAETAVVGFPHELKGEGLYAFIILKDGVTVAEDEIKAALRALVRKNIAGYAVPDHLLVSDWRPLPLPSLSVAIGVCQGVSLCI